MRHHLNDRFMLRAISTMLVVLAVMLGSVMPAATSSRLGPEVDDGGAGGTRGTVVVDAPTQNELSTMLTESREAPVSVVLSGDMRQIQLIEGMQPKSAFVEAGDAASAYCYRCYSYR